MFARILLLSVLLMGLVAGLFLIINPSGTFFNPRAASFETIRPNYDFSCLKTNKCFNLIDNSNEKAVCYQKCRNFISNNSLSPNSASSNSSTIDQYLAAEKEYTYMSKYLVFYANTLFGQYRNYWIGQRDASGKQHVEGHYYRSVCSLVAVGTLKGLVEKMPDSYFLYYQNKLMSVFDDYNSLWGRTDLDSAFELGVNGYECGLAASLLWPKFSDNIPWDITSGHPGRTADQKRKLIKEELLDLANKVKTLKSTDQYIKEEQNYSIDNGDSKAEEVGGTASFLTLISKLVPSRANEYFSEASKAIKFSSYHCEDQKICPVTSDFLVVNHGISPHPQYTISVLMNAARASLPLYLFDGKDRDIIPPEFRLSGPQSKYDLVNLFESTMRYTNLSDMTLMGNYVVSSNSTVNWLPNSHKFEDVIWLGRHGVSEWGTGMDENASAYAFMYINDKYNWNGYKSLTGAYGLYLAAEDRKLNSSNNTYANNLYLPPTFKDGKWQYIPLTSAPGLPGRYPTRQTIPCPDSSPLLKGHCPSGEINHPITDEEKVNTHLFHNSLKAFEHLVSYLYLSGNNLLNKME